MITNLLATLTTFLATNTVEVVTRYEYYDPPGSLRWNDGQWPSSSAGQGRNPLAKTLTTTITRTDRLIYEWPVGTRHTNDVVVVVDQSSKHYQLERVEKWVETAGTLTHFPRWINYVPTTITNTVTP